MKLEEMIDDSCKRAFEIGRVQGMIDVSKWLNQQHFDMLSLMTLKLASQRYDRITEEYGDETITPNPQAINTGGNRQEVEGGVCSQSDSVGLRAVS